MGQLNVIIPDKLIDRYINGLCAGITPSKKVAEAKLMEYALAQVLNYEYSEIYKKLIAELTVK